jgi:altronate hydrolase
MKGNLLIIHPLDNVGVALRTIEPGAAVPAEGLEGLVAREKIPASHKIALRDIAQGEEIIKYGETVAITIREIKKGEWVHTHNLESKRWKR